MIHDSDDDRMPRLYMALWTLVLLFIAFAWGAWVQRSDARALEQIASEHCKPAEVAFVRPDGSQTICLRGSQRAGGARR
jgi:hypothetical protein